MPNLRWSNGSQVLFCVLLLAGWPGSASDDFDRYLVYETAVHELNAEYQLHREHGQKLLADREDTLKRLADTDGDIAQLRTNRDWHAYLLLENSLVAAAVDFDAQMLVDQNTATNPSGEVRPAQRFRVSPAALSAGHALANQASHLKVRGDALMHHIKTLNAAGQITLQRRFALVQQLNQIVSEMHQWRIRTVKLFDEYWALADVAGVRCDVELRAALRRLQQAEEDNVGAMFVQAVTLTRLGRLEESLEILNELARIAVVRPVCLAARAEVHQRIGDERQATIDLREAMAVGRNDVRVRIQRAQALIAGGDFKGGESEWEAVLKLGGHEIAARRALATINALHPDPAKKQLTQATEQATLASRLSAAQDWGCEIAVALAAAANGDTDQAIAAAERASKLALGCKRSLCEDVAENVQQGRPLPWPF